jgi:hypothetical protein
VEGGNFLTVGEGYGQRAGRGRMCDVSGLGLRFGSRYHCGMSVV